MQSWSRYWLCKCICGKEVTVSHYKLVNNSSKSCNCDQPKGWKRINITGHTYDQLTVLKEAESRYEERFWLCQCSCGTTKVIAQRHLRSGKVQSCGCKKKRKSLLKEPSSHIDRPSTLSGQVYGELTVLKKAPKRHGKRYWLCKCSCGAEKEIRQYSLKKGLTESCGCLAKGKRKKNYVLLPGQQFNYWTVLEESPRKNKYRYWRCKCACGTEKNVAQRSLTSGASKSCGCQSKLTKNRGKDLTGQHIHDWTVIEEAPRRYKLRYWRCRCLCGTEKDVAQHSLVTGQSKSCGCRSKRDS